jgi:hypothetical protein
VFVHDERSIQEVDREGDSEAHLKTTTGAEAAISLALASAIAMDSGLQEEEEAMPITARVALYLYAAGARKGATCLIGEARAACASDDRVGAHVSRRRAEPPRPFPVL